MIPKPSYIADPWLAAQPTQAVFDAIERGGFCARAVGGAVRNALLGLPATDIDIATDALPADTVRLAAAAGLKTIPTGLAHGTVTVMSGDMPFEVTTLRRDVATDGRHAEVAFTADWAADAARRDFTINALYCDRHGALFDPLGGLTDLEPVRIRFIGDPCQRIEEDYLRILRFFRFSATYTADGALDPEGLAACADLRAGLARISGERISVELDKLLVARQAAAVTRTLVEFGVFHAIAAIPTRLARLTRLIQIEDRLGRRDGVLRLAALAACTPDDARQLSERLRLSQRSHVRLIAAAQMPAIKPAMDERAGRAALYRLGADAFIDEVLLAWSGGDVPICDAAFTSLATLPGRWQIPVFPIRGADVLAQGVAAGPLVGTLLAELCDRWIDSDFSLGIDDLRLMLHARVTAQPHSDRG